MQVIIEEDRQLDACDFLALVQRVWPGQYDLESVVAALTQTINLTARVDGRLVGSVRLLTDGYFYGTVAELLVDPLFRRRGIGRALMEAAWVGCPTSLAFGVQPGNEAFFSKCGFEPGLPTVQRPKPRGTKADAVRIVLIAPDLFLKKGAAPLVQGEICE